MNIDLFKPDRDDIEEQRNRNAKLREMQLNLGQYVPGLFIDQNGKILLAMNTQNIGQVDVEPYPKGATRSPDGVLGIEGQALRAANESMIDEMEGSMARWGRQVIANGDQDLHNLRLARANVAGLADSAMPILWDEATKRWVVRKVFCVWMNDATQHYANDFSFDEDGPPYSVHESSVVSLPGNEGFIGLRVQIQPARFTPYVTDKDVKAYTMSVGDVELTASLVDSPVIDNATGLSEKTSQIHGGYTKTYSQGSYTLPIAYVVPPKLNKPYSIVPSIGMLTNFSMEESREKQARLLLGNLEARYGFALWQTWEDSLWETLRTSLYMESSFVTASVEQMYQRA